MRSRCLIGFMAVGVVLAGCGGDDDDTAFTRPEGFVGRVDGTDAYIAVVASESAVEVYACDGASGIQQRLRGDVDDPTSFTLTGGGDEAATVAFAEGRYAGEVTLADGSTHAFTTEPAEGDAGLYHLVDPPVEVHAGWVVLNDGTQRGSFAMNPNFNVRQAPPISGTGGPLQMAQMNMQFARATPP